MENYRRQICQCYPCEGRLYLEEPETSWGPNNPGMERAPPSGIEELAEASKGKKVAITID